MGRLTAPPSRLAEAPSRVAVSAGPERDRVRRQVAHWRKWYSTKRWRALRRAVLKRDAWTCRQTGVLLIGKDPAPNSPVVDHIQPHRGDPDLFWDIENLQAVSKAWHDSEKQRIERGAGGGWGNLSNPSPR